MKSLRSADFTLRFTVAPLRASVSGISVPDGPSRHTERSISASVATRWSATATT